MTKELKEEMFRGIPDHVFRTETSKYVSNIKQKIYQYVLMNKFKNASEQKNAIDSINVSMESLEEEINDILHEELYAFMRNI